MKKKFMLRILLIIPATFALLLTSCAKRPEPNADEKLEEKNISLETENRTGNSIEIESAIEEKEEAEKAVAEKSEAEAERIAEEESINLIIEENQEMIKDFLMNPTVEVVQIWVQISVFDFTNDGKKEIMLSKEYITKTLWGGITYNYVYDREGNELFEFLGGATSSMTICADRNTMGFYFCSETYRSARDDTFWYAKVVKREDWENEVSIGAWVGDNSEKSRPLNPEDSDCIFYITSESEQNIFVDAYDGMKIVREKEAHMEWEQLEEYLQSFEELEENKLDFRGSIIYSQGEFIMSTDGERSVLWAEE